MELKRLIDWMKLLSGQERFYKEGNLTVHVYGEEDQSYVVIEEEISESPRVVDQYTVHPLQKENGLYALVNFLNECEFDLKNLASKISRAVYVEDGMSDIFRFEHVEVARYQVQEN